MKLDFLCSLQTGAEKSFFFKLLNNNSAFELLENGSVFSVSCVQRLL